MNYLFRFVKNMHRELDPNFSFPPFMTISLIIIYTLVIGAFGYLLGIDIFTDENYTFSYVFESLLIRSIILIFFINFNAIFVFLLIRWFRSSKVKVSVIYSYYALFATIIFIIALAMFFSVIIGYYVLHISPPALLNLFGASIVIVMTLTNLYPAYVLYIAIRNEKIDLFWPIIICILGIHLMTFLLFRMWNMVDVIMLWA